MTPRKIQIRTLTSAATSGGENMCNDRRTCHGVHTLADRPEQYYVVVTEVTDAAELAAFAQHIGPGEKLGTMQRRIIDEVPR